MQKLPSSEFSSPNLADSLNDQEALTILDESNEHFPTRIKTHRYKPQNSPQKGASDRLMNAAKINAITAQRPLSVSGCSKLSCQSGE